MENKNNKNKNNKNNSSNSLVFGLWPQTKMPSTRRASNPQLLMFRAVAQLLNFEFFSIPILSCSIPDLATFTLSWSRRRRRRRSRTRSSSRATRDNLLSSASVPPDDGGADLELVQPLNSFYKST